MGLGKFERELLFKAIKLNIIRPPLAYAYRIPLRDKISVYEPTPRDLEVDALSEWEKGFLDVFEIKMVLDEKAIGQLFVYEYYIGKMPRFSQRTIRKHVICAKAQEHFKRVCEHLNIIVHEIGE